MEQIKDISVLNSHSQSSSNRSSKTPSSERNPPEPQRNEIEETKFKQRKKEASNGKNTSPPPPLLGQKMTSPIKPLNKNHDDKTQAKHFSKGRSRPQQQQHGLLEHSTEHSIEATNDESTSGSNKDKRKLSLTQKNSNNPRNKSTIILNHSEEESGEATGPSKTEASPQNATGSFYPSIGYVTPPKTKTSMTAYYHSSLAGPGEIPKEQRPMNPSRSRSTVRPPDHHASLINSFIETTKKEPLPKIKNETKPSPLEALRSKNPIKTEKSSSIIKVEEGGDEKANNFDEGRRNSNQLRTIIPHNKVLSGTAYQNNHKKSFYISGLINKQSPADPELFSKPPRQNKPQLNLDKEVLEHLLIRTSMKEPEIMQLFEAFETLLEETKSPGQFLDKRRFKEYLKRTANIHGDDFIDCIFRHGNHLLLTTDGDWIAFKEAVVMLDKLNQDSPFSIMSFVFKLSVVPNEKKSSLSLVRSLLQEIRVANKTGMVSLLLDSLDYIHTYENISRLTLLSFEEYLELVKRYQPMRRFS